MVCAWRWKIQAKAWILSKPNAFSNLFLQPSRLGSEWDWPSVARLLRRMVDGCGLPPKLPTEQSFNLHCRWWRMIEPKPTVFVIDDDAAIRDALQSLISSMKLHVELFGSAAEFLQRERPDVPSCLVLDVRLPGISGLEFQRKLTEANHSIPVIFITGHGDIPMSVRAMKAGAVEFLTKPFHDQDLLDAIHTAIERDRERRREAVLAAELRERYATLTERERQIMALVVVGRANKQIAAELNLSEMTVKVHRGQVMRKMQAGSLPGLVRMADRLGVPTTS